MLVYSHLLSESYLIPAATYVAMLMAAAFVMFMSASMMSHHLGER